MQLELENKLKELKDKTDITNKELHDVFIILQEVLNKDIDLFNELFDNFYYFLKETNYDKYIYADFLFIITYYKEDLKKYSEYKEFFVKKFDFKSDEFLDLDRYENKSTVYSYHDGMPILQSLKVNDDEYDIVYNMGKNKEKHHYYYKVTVNKELLEQFHNDKLSLKDILLLDDANVVQCVESESGHHYTLHPKDITEIKEEISDKLYVSFFSEIWGDAEEWGGIVLH